MRFNFICERMRTLNFGGVLVILNNDKKYLLSSVNNALEILDLLSKYKELSLAEICKHSNLGKTSAFKILYTLKKRSFVYKTNEAKYKLGIKFAHYGALVLERQNELSNIKPFLKELRDRHNDTVHLSILNDDLNIIFVAKESGNTSIQMQSNIGVELPAYCTGTGKVLLAGNLDEGLKERIHSLELEKLTSNTITDAGELIKVLELIKEQGYGEDLEESEIGLTCYAAPIRNIDGEVVYAISISGPTNRMEVKRDELISSVKYYADEISKLLGYQK